jgi:pantoate--beta-alanine ligase
MMRRLTTVADLRDWRAAQVGCVLVPTMGGLHAGHLSLIRLAQQHALPVVASIFVNPLQFGIHDDFDRYPRTYEADCLALEQVGCDAVFAPSQREVYPGPQTVFVEPPASLSTILEGAFRPGFFRGVCTVVTKLFHLVEPNVAVFGKKDYQQWRVIEAMVKELMLPIEIVGGETVREADGLAMSSRNSFLSLNERKRASELPALLQSLGTQYQRAPLDILAACQRAEQSLQAKGWDVDYVVARERHALQTLHAHEPAVLLAAARVGSTRLIDSLELHPA